MERFFAALRPEDRDKGRATHLREVRRAHGWPVLVRWRVRQRYVIISLMREFATVAEIADEIRRRLGIRSAESSAIDAGRSENIVRIDELATEDDHGFVKGLYSKVLRRPARPEEIAAGFSALQGVSRAEFAAEIHCSAEAREKGNVIYDLLSPSEQIQFPPPTISPLVPPIEHHRKVYHLFDLLAFEGAAYLIHLYRSVAKCQPDDALLRRHLDALEQKRSTPLEILIEVVSSREARAAGTIVLGISDLVRRNEMKSAPLAVLAIDPQKMEYTAGELLTVPQNLFITHLYRCLLKRDPDPEGEANYSARNIYGASILG